MQIRPTQPPQRIIAAIVAIIIFLILILCAITAVLAGEFMAQRGRATGTPVAQSSQEKFTNQPTDTHVPPTLTLVQTPTSNPQVDLLLSEMSLEQKAGQMIIGVIPGESAAGEGEMMISEHFIGSIIYFDVNVNNLNQAAQLSQDLQWLAAKNNPAIPLLIAMDYEPGTVGHFDQDAIPFPSNMAMAAAGSADLVYQAAAASALQLRAAGIYLSLGPVVDINSEPRNPVIGLRSFGSNPEQVSLLGQAYISGLQDNGVVATAKHFPGHGDTTIDSHDSIPFINKSLAMLQSSDLMPFYRAINQQVGAVMVSHVANQELDPQGLPASLSPTLVNGLLRNQMGFQGVVITDGMMMAAIYNNFEPEEAVLRAVEAGCDLLLFTNPHMAADAQGWIVSAVQRGRISAEQVEASTRRILALKAGYGLLSFPLPGPLPISMDNDRALGLEIARKSIYSQGPANFPLIRPGPLTIISPDIMPKGTNTEDNLSLLGEILDQKGFVVTEWIYPLGDLAQAKAIQDRALSDLPAGEPIILITRNASFTNNGNQSGSQAQLINSVANLGAPAIYIAIGLPYDLNLYPSSAPALATFGFLDAQIQALAESLLSPSPPPGKLPVSLQD